MRHQEIEDKEIIERYVLDQLSTEERRAFQEHFFACDACFDEVQMTARFIAGVRRSSLTGRPAESVAAATPAGVSLIRVRWYIPAFLLAATATVVLAVLLGWLLFGHIPKLRGEVEREKQARERVERDRAEIEKEEQQRLERAQDELESARGQLESEKSERAKLQTRLEALARNQAPAGSGRAAQANAPIVILEAARDQQAGNQLTLTAGAGRATLWIEVEADNRFANYSLQILSSDGRLIDTVAGARPNAYGAVAVSVPANLLRTGKYVVKLYGVKGHQRELLGEYNLSVRKP